MCRRGEVAKEIRLCKRIPDIEVTERSAEYRLDIKDGLTTICFEGGGIIAHVGVTGDWQGCKCVLRSQW